MRENLPVTGTEYTLNEGEDLISSTDLKGRIRNANDAFVRVSGFDWEELHGSAHNIVRHPDMPEAAYADMWATLQSDRAWMGIVKNRRKNGDHYWVDAFVTPAYENGQKVGYESVRRVPSREHVERAEKVYAAMKRGRQFRRHLWDSLLFRLLGVWGLGFALALGVLLAPWGALAQGLGLALVFALGGASTLGLMQPLQRTMRGLRRIFDNPAMETIYCGRRDGSATLELFQRFHEARLFTVLDRIEEQSGAVSDGARTMAGAVEQTASGVTRQQGEIDQVATAMNEMTSTIQEMAQNSAQAADSAHHAEQETRSGEEVVNATVEAINRMAGEVETTAEKLNRLETDAAEIDNILGVIREIAEQTNLLALNAAIEAARAGEHGRGFAVVADEVRRLSQRTDESTVTIRQMIETLQNGSREAVSAMRSSQEQAAHGVEQAQSAGESLGRIREAVGRITEMNTQIATAVEEQSSVAEEINRNVTSIHDVAGETGTVAEHAREASADMERLAGELKSLIHRFDTRV
ncbi:PAS domain-containing methyl-accepting chemotaxis protein [Thioalkalivibrio sp. ALgr3]|uniref:methyl-accepting chemotaxis protein n=1 Tax=Thioalkalivibrio sp. ALgr3 TaxID=1239292 RepID=UPI0003805D8F|nr:PAS domain-containing methyl-accepting chemotaxis protein [Thioalkalivibrio sp. ALgr3]